MMANLDKMCYIRFLHAIPGSQGVDILINDKEVAGNIGYKDFTEYYTACPGIYTLRAYPAGKRTDSVIDEHMELCEDVVYTAVAAGTNESPELVLICDQNKKESYDDKACVRYVNLSPDSAGFNISMDSDALSVNSLEYLEDTDYMTVAPGDYNIKIMDAATGGTVAEHPGLKLKEDRYYALCIVGLKEGHPELQILSPLEGITYLPIE